MNKSYIEDLIKYGFDSNDSIDDCLSQSSIYDTLIDDSVYSDTYCDNADDDNDNTSYYNRVKNDDDIMIL